MGKKLNTGCQPGEPDSIYFGGGDKPAFGSGAIKLFIEDPRQFYRQQVVKNLAEKDWGSVGAVGHAVEEFVLEGKSRTMETGIAGEYGKAFKELVRDNPDKLVLTTKAAAEVKAGIDAGINDRFLPELVRHGTPQVVYRSDHGPFYLQAKVDLAVMAEHITPATKDALNIDQEGWLFVDTKTTATLFGSRGFRRNINSYMYPVQDAFYRIVADDCLPSTRSPSDIAFRFCGLSKTAGEGSEWVQSIDVMEVVTDVVYNAIATLKERYLADDWSDLATDRKMTLVTVPDNYLSWSEM